MTARLMHKSVLLPMIGAAALATALAGCGKPGAKPGGPPPGMMVNVVAVKATAEPIEDTLTFVGTLMANESVEVRSEIDGTIEEIGFKEGQKVKKGSTLFRIDQGQLKASLSKAEAEMKLAEATRKRYDGLVEGGAVSRQEFDQAVSAFDAAKAAVDLLKEQLSDATIEAPFDGTAGSREISLGQYVSRGTPLTMLVSQDPVKVEFQVPERYLSLLKEKQPVSVSVAAYPDVLFTGDVYFIAPQIDPSLRTVLVKALVPNPDNTLRHGMFASVSLRAQLREKAVVIPESALVIQGKDTVVFAVDAEGAVQSRPVKTGLRLAGKAEIVSGVDPGDVVIIEGTQKVGPGAKVAVRYAEPAKAPALVPTAAR